MIRIKLVNNAGYGGFDAVKFPVEVSASRTTGVSCLQVHESELTRIGCDMQYLTDDCDPLWPFNAESYEVINDDY